jgi:hypothetical protein
MTRQPHSDPYDATVRLEPTPDGYPSFAYVIAKSTYSLAGRRPERVAAEPLRKDPYDPGCVPKLPWGSDFWWMKRHTDVVVEGAAWAPGGRPAARAEVRCRVGDRDKRIAVFGARRIEWTRAGLPFIGPPELFESIPLDDEHAYGGIDPRVPIPPILRPEDALAAVADHPGAYPRNPMGKGYLVVRERVDGVELPNLEDPDDLLTDERLVVGDPRSWHHQPLPWTLGWQHAMALTRLAKLGADARFPVADPGSLKEVQKGFLPADYRERGRRRAGFEVAFQQEASLGMTFAPLAAETPIAVEGVHPERRAIDFVVPSPPRCEIAIEGHKEAPPPLLTAVVLSPDALRVSFVYVARTRSLPRRFIPGVHPTIPLSAAVDGGVPVHYVTPPVRRHPAA